MIRVTLQQLIYSRAPAEAGSWCQHAERDVPAVPRGGDEVELADGWASQQVRRASFGADGTVIINLDPVRTDSPHALAEHWELVDNHGWHWVGSAPARPREGES